MDKLKDDNAKAAAAREAEYAAQLKAKSDQIVQLEQRILEAENHPQEVSLASPSSISSAESAAALNLTQTQLAAAQRDLLAANNKCKRLEVNWQNLWMLSNNFVTGHFE